MYQKVYPSDNDPISDRLADLKKISKDIDILTNNNSEGKDESLSYLSGIGDKLSILLNYVDKDGVDPISIAKDNDFIEDLDFLVMVNDIKPFIKLKEVKGPDSDENENNIYHIDKSTDRQIFEIDVKRDYLKDIYNDRLDVNGMKGWQIKFLHKHLHDIFPESENIDKGLEELHLPAMFRYFGMTNLRADKTSITFGEQKIYVSAVPHGSHVPVKLKGVTSKDMVDITKRSIKEIESAELHDSYSPMTQLSNLGITGLESDIYLTTYVSDFNIQSKDTKVIDTTRKAVDELNSERGEQKFFYNNMAIQSGFYLFEDFFSKESYKVAENINKRSEVILNQLSGINEETKDEVNDDEKIKKEKYYGLLKAINDSYNKSLMQRDVVHKTSNVIFYTLVSLALISLVSSLAFSGAGFVAMIISVAIPFGLIFGLSAFQSKNRNSLFDSILSPRVAVLLIPLGFTVGLIFAGIGVLTSPFSLPIMAGVSITLGLFALVGIAFVSRSYFVPASANNTYIAALQSINISLNGDIADVGCQEAKDRTASVRIMANALLSFYAEYRRMPDMGDHMYLRSVAASTATISLVSVLVSISFGLSLLSPIGLAFIALGAVGLAVGAYDYAAKDKSDISIMTSKIEGIILSDFDANLAGRNTKGGDGIKHLKSYMPKVIIKNMKRETISHIEGYDKKTELFGVPGVKKTAMSASSMSVRSQTVELSETTHPRNGKSSKNNINLNR